MRRKLKNKNWQEAQLNEEAYCWQLLRLKVSGWKVSIPALCLLTLVICGVAGSLARAQAVVSPNALNLDFSAVEQLEQVVIAPPPASGTVDWVPSKYQLGQQLYLENCSTCHVPVPPQTLPAQTWQQLLQDAQHYGVQIQPLIDPQRILVWNYLRLFSRPLDLKEEQIPFKLSRSRYFKALHPKVEFSQPVNLSGCVTCHPGAAEYNFRKLTPEWQNAP
ncbi:MAG: diheme cytochrome C [Microcoleaceae cyanobacterium]